MDISSDNRATLLPHSLLLDCLDRTGVAYAILHGWQTLPCAQPSDIDVIMSPDDRKRLEAAAQTWDGFQLVQRFQYEAGGVGYTFAVKHTQPPQFVTLDVSTDYRWDGVILFSAHDLLQHRSRWQGWWVVGPQQEFAYLLAKKIFEKRSIPAAQQKRIEELLRDIGSAAERICVRLFGATWGSWLVAQLAAHEWQTITAHIPHLGRGLRWQRRRQDPLNIFRYWAAEAGRIWQRCRRPTGLHVAVLGPDGAGKSTLVAHLKAQLSGAFRRSTVFHFRPFIFESTRISRPVTRPHAQEPHPRWRSVLKLAYYVLDFFVGWLGRVYPQYLRSTLVLFDRYFEDIIVDPKRYRYAGPRWLARVAAGCIPRPDMVFILDVPEATLAARTQEVSSVERRRQVAAYRHLAASLPHAVLLNGSASIQTVVRCAEASVLDFLYERYQRRYAAQAGKGLNETLAWLTSVLCTDLSADVPRVHFTRRHAPGKSTDWTWLPLPNGRGYLLPQTSRSVAVAATSLIDAQRPWVHIARNLLVRGQGLGLVQPFLPKVHLRGRPDVADGDRASALLLDHIRDCLGDPNVVFALSSGRPGPRQKPVAALLTQTGDVRGFAKIGWNAVTNVAIQNEANALQRLASVPFSRLILPRLLYQGWWQGRFICVQSAQQTAAERCPTRLLELHTEAMQELSSIDRREQPLSTSLAWQTLQTAVSDGTSRSVQPPVLPILPQYRAVLEAGAVVLDQTWGRSSIPVAFGHGDFAPWNMRQGAARTARTAGTAEAKEIDRLYVFDWEYAHGQTPVGSDVCHFVIQSLLLIRKWTGGQLYDSFQRGGVLRQQLRAGFSQLRMVEELLEPVLLLYVLQRIAVLTAGDQINRSLVHNLTQFAYLLIGRMRG